MSRFRPYALRHLALLLAALLLLSNALVTAHAFGEADHAAQDNCEILHQFERQQLSPTDLPATLPDIPRHSAPSTASHVAIATDTVRYCQPRAPPFV